MMDSKINFPDQNHVEQIRKRLWCGREFGQATVMVGAGFSLNAEKISPSIPSFPLWNQLAEKIYDCLYPQNQSDDKNWAIASKGALRLASEYEIVFGRSSLDDLIIESVPDTQYLPGKLHELLLSLPWSDVFTTNYDTLLERTRPAIYERKYDLVLTHSDLPGRMQPRIVKLHGSFPSHRPFIITEEDYRTYPKKFASFVNMVQQSIMENVFCLIGFSGEDPNFLNWIGWVRDNLGEATPPIYLCGLLNLSNSQRQLLTNKKIIPVDLSPIFPNSEWPDRKICHAKALEWFLLNLMYGKPPSVMTWPIPSSYKIRKPSEGLPAIPPGPPQLSDPGKFEPHSFDYINSDFSFGPLKVPTLEQLYTTWSQNRQEYPGWVVCPKKNRDNLWRYTEKWIEPVLCSIENLPSPDKLLLLYELNWRLETTLTPLFTDWIEKIIPIIESFNPYPTLVEITNATVTPKKEEFRKLDWKLIGECWVELAFALVREARENHDESQFQLWIENLRNVVKIHTVWQARWFYEQCLFYLFRLDQENVRTTLEQWPITPDLPFWEVKRASLLAELGDLKEAERIAQAALTGIRSRLKPYSEDYILLSQEGWAMLLLQTIQYNNLNFEEDFVGQYRARWQKLETYQCNPFFEMETLSLIVDRPPPTPKPEKEIKRGFEPGYRSVSYHWSSLPSIYNFLPAFAFLRIFEEGGLPIKCGRVVNFSKVLVTSTKWTAPFASFWSLSSIIRTGKKQEIYQLFNLIYILTLSNNEIDYINNLLFKALNQAIQNLPPTLKSIDSSKSSSLEKVTLFTELMSRLAFRLSPAQINQILKVTIALYKQPVFRQYHSLENWGKPLFKRIFKCISPTEIFPLMAELLSLPISGENGFEVSQPLDWEDPFIYVEWTKGIKLTQGFDRSAWSITIANLLRIIRDGSPESRKCAALRLERLYQINGLTSEESQLFAQALWSRLSPVKQLPSDTVFYDFAFLQLPEPQVGIAKENFRQYLASQEFPRVIQYSNNPDGTQGRSVNPNSYRYIMEWVNGTEFLFTQNEEETQKFVDWSSDEAEQLLKKVAAAWDEDKNEVQQFFDKGVLLITDDLQKHFYWLVQLLSVVILPRLATSEEEIKTLANKLLSELEQLGICVLSALPTTLFIDANAYDKVARKLRVNLNSMKEQEVRDAILGFCYWLIHSAKQSIPNPPADLLNELINRLVYRRQPGLNSALAQVSGLVRRLPDLFNESHQEALCVALEYLIKETELLNKQELETISDFTTVISVDDRPEYRQLAAQLAYELYRLFSQRPDAELPQILARWKEICQNDPLPEVRKVWVENGSED